MRLPIDLMDSKAASDALGCTIRTLQNLRNRGLLNPVFLYGKGPGKPVYYRRSEIVGFFDGLAKQG